MRYEGKRKSRVDPQKDVYCFVMGIEEVKALKDIINDFLFRCPKILETSQMRNRVGAMRKEIGYFMNYKNFDKREPSVPEDVRPN